MAAATGDSTQDWLLPEHSRPPLIGELERRVDEALATARASEAAVMTIGAAAIDAAEQAERAAGLAEKASATALEAQDRVASMSWSSRRRHPPPQRKRTTASATSAPGPTGSSPACDGCSGFPWRHPQPAMPQAGRNPLTDLACRCQRCAVERKRRLDSADRAGEKDLAGLQVGNDQALFARLDSIRGRRLDRLPAGDRGQDAPVRGRRHQPPLADDEDAGSRCLEHGSVRIEEQRQLAARGGGGGSVEQPPVGPLVLAEAALDADAAQGGAMVGGGKDAARIDLSGRDLQLQLARGRARP